MTETQLVNNIRRAILKEYGGFWFKSHGGPFQRAGLPDLIGCCKGRYVGVEVKLPGKEDTLTKVQAHTIELINHAGGIAFMSTSPKHTLQQIKRGLKNEEVTNSKAL